MYHNRIDYIKGRLQDKPWGLGIPALGVGVMMSRIMAESSITAWRVVPLVLVLLASIGFGLLLVALLRKVTRQIWPLALLLLYGLWPTHSPPIAWAMLLGVLVMLGMLNLPRLPSGLWLGGGVFAFMLTLYVSTLAPTVLPADSGEFQLVSAVLGIAHPPGYPLYTMLGRLFTLLPIGEVAWRVNLFGAVCGALTLAIVAHSVRRTTDSVAAALVAVGALGLSTTYWSQSTTANIRSLTALLTALCLALLLRWGEKQEQRYLVALGACFGLAVGHHSSLSLLGLPFLAYVLVCAPRLMLEPRRWGLPLVAFVTSLLVLLYLPLRSLAGASFDPAPIRSWDGFLSHVLALGFRGDLFYFRTLSGLGARLDVWHQIMRLEFGPWLSVAFLLAIVPVGLRRGRVLVPLLGTWVINTLAALTYRAPQTVEYLMPSYVALAFLLGYGLGYALRRWHARVSLAFVVLLVLAVAWNGQANYGSLQEFHRDTSARDYAEAILRDAPPQTIVLSNWHHATAFWYLQQVEGLRRDVEVRYVYPEGETPNEQVWLRRIAEDIAARPVIVTNWFYAFQHTTYRWLPLHNAWLVRREPLTILPERVVTQEAIFEEGIHVLGYDLESDTLAPGDILGLRVYWQTTSRLQRDYSSFVQLLGPDGVLGQGDVVHRSDDVVPGEIQVDTYHFPVLLHASPGDYQLVTGFYWDTGGSWQRLHAGSADSQPLAHVSVQGAMHPSVTLHPMEQHWANGLRLTGTDYDRSIAGQTRLYLHWWRPRAMPITIDPWRGLPDEGIQVYLGQSGKVIAQGKLAALAPGQALTLALDVPDETERVTLSLAFKNGQALTRLGAWHRPLSDPLLALPRKPVHYVPLGGEMAFVGWGRSSQKAIIGQDLWLRPRLLSLRPLMADYTISVGLANRGVSWEQKSDATPAMGAIPTLKWVRGWQVEDMHVLHLSPDTPPGQALKLLSVYDAFTLVPLAVLDERFVRQGQGIQLELDAVLMQR